MSNILKEYYKYCIVGFIVTALDFSMLTFQVEFLQLYYLIAAGSSYFLASFAHYLLSVKYVFTRSETEKSFKSFFIFFILGVAGLILLETLMFYFVEKIEVHYLIAKIFATGLIFTFNFTTRKLLLFK